MDADLRIVAGVLLATTVAAGFQAVASVGAIVGEEPCSGGTGGGEFALPATSPGVGALEGRLVDEATDTVAYRIEARLVSLPAPCQGCLQGEVEGTLDDGSGGPPEFVVAGDYAGTLFGGIGQVHLRVYGPDGGEAVGTLTAAFEDMPGGEEPGRFSGEWRLCPSRGAP